MHTRPLFLVALFAVLISAVAGEWGIQAVNVTIPTSTGNTTVSVAIGPTNTTVLVVHCFGEINFYYGGDSPPTTENYTLKHLWSDGGATDQYFAVSNLANGTAYILAVCVNKYSPVCASFDLLYFIAPTLIQDFFPFPPIPSITATESSSQQSGTATFNKTGNSADSYSLYYTTSSPPTGYYPSTACGLRSYVNALTGAQGNVTSNTSYSETVSLSFKSSTRLTLAVVVDRQGGYSSVYNTITFNSASSLIPSLVVLLVIGFISLF